MIEEKINYKTDFGVIELRLKKLMDEKNISINMMSRFTGIKYDVVKQYYYGNKYGYNGEILAKFCYILKCDLSEILVYLPSKNLEKSRPNR